MVNPRRAQEAHDHPYSTEMPWLVPAATGGGDGSKALLDDGTWGVVSSSLGVEPQNSTVAYLSPNGAGNVNGIMLQGYATGTNQSAAPPSGGGTDFASRAKVGRSPASTTAGFYTGVPSDGRFAHYLRGWGSVVKFGVTDWDELVRLQVGMTQYVSAGTGTTTPPGYDIGVFTKGSAVGSDRLNLWIGSYTDIVDTGYTLQEGLEYTVTSTCAAGGSTIDVTLECENGDYAEHTVTMLTGHQTNRFMMRAGMYNSTGAASTSTMWLIYMGVVMPD